MGAIVFDLGGTHFRAGIVTASGRLEKVRIERLDHCGQRLTSAAVWSRVVNSILQTTTTAEESGDVDPGAPIVIAFPGPVEAGKRILRAPTLLGESSDPPDLHRAIWEVTRREVILLNDVSAATWHLSTRIDTGRFMVVTVSSGIGSKIFDHSSSRGVLDDQPFAGEIGHWTVDTSPDAAQCDCGGRGHLGAIASGRGIENTARIAAREDLAGFSSSACFTRFGATPSTLRNESHLVPAVLADDVWATTIVTRCTAKLACCLGAVAMALGLEKIVVMGGFASALGEPYIRILRNAFTEHTRGGFWVGNADACIELIPRGEEVGLLGAAAYANARFGSLR